jgi:threonine aldolase
MDDPVYDLRSDTVTRPSPEMKRAMMEAPLGDDVLGDDPTVQRLESMIAGMTGKEAALFFPSGTQANQTAVHLLTEPGTEVLIEKRAHIFNYEAGAPAMLSSVQLHPVETPDGIFRFADLEPLMRPVNEHFPQTRLLCLENTHNGHGGKVYPIDEMEGVAAWARERGLAIHLDGARLYNAVAASGVAAGRFAACADTVSICMSKGLGAPIGTCLMGDAETIGRARWVRKRLGGGMRQVGILAAAAIFALEHNIDRLTEDHAVANGIAEGLAELDGITVDPRVVESNIVLIDVEASAISAAHLVEALGMRGVKILAIAPGTLRAVTHLDVPPDAADEVPRRFEAALADLATRARTDEGEAGE